MALAQAGVDVVVNGRDEASVEATAAEIAGATGAKATPVTADVSTGEGQAKLLRACPDPDILINNNGGPPFADFRQLDRQAMLDGVVMNMVTPIELIQAVIEPMIARKFGRIVNITSASVRTPLIGLDLSSGARAGLTAFLAGVARQVAAHNITVNHLLPGPFDTDRLSANFAAAAKRAGKTAEEVRDARIAGVPAKRLGTAEEFGQACAFLCSVHAGYITGQSMLMDGGAFNTVV